MDDLLSTPACTLPTVERPLRLAELDALFALASDVRHEGRTVRMHLSGPPTLREQALDLAARETACCSFFTFDVTGSPSEVDLEISAPDQHRALVAALARRAADAAR